LNQCSSETTPGRGRRLIGTVCRKLAIFIVPAAILASAGVGLSRLGALPPVWQELLPYLPLLTIVGGIMLSLHFHRGRVFLVLLMLAAFTWTLLPRLRAGLPDPSGGVLLQLFAFLIPLNITLFCFMRERGVLTTAGRMRLIFLALQGGAAAWLVRSHPDWVADFLARKITLAPLPDVLTLSQPALVALLLGLSLMAVRMVLRQSPIDSAFLGTLIAVAVACNWPWTKDLPTLFVTAAALTLTLGVLQDSYNMAFRDDLTGLPSRRALNELLMGLGRQYVIAMLDVDHFKSFNDTYGHDVGDQVLRMVARKIHGVKGGGKPFRYGGEEFTVIFPRRRLAEAIPHLEEVRRAIGGYQLALRDNDRPKQGRQGKKQRGSGKEARETVSVTISIGVAESGDRATPAVVLKEADQALYRAKRKGRNQLSK
jgi:GGDEF domain-containing protein